jgi:hypothetical protein
MSQANHVPTTSSFTRQFEELPLFTHFAHGEKLTAGLIDGEMEVTYSTVDGTWWVSDLWIRTDNHRFGAASKSGQLNLNADTDERFYFSILDSLTERYCDLIDEEIADELAELGIRVAA